MPKREKGEPLNEFVGRFAKSKREQKKFPDLKQRLAVAYDEARRKKSK